MSVLCSVFQTIDLPQHLAQGPLLHNHDHASVKTKEPLQAAYRIIHKTIHQRQSILQSSITGILDSLRNTNNDLNYDRVPVLFGDRHLGPPTPAPLWGWGGWWGGGVVGWWGGGVVGWWGGGVVGWWGGGVVGWLGCGSELV